MKSLKAFLCLIDFTDQMALAWECADGWDGSRDRMECLVAADLVRL